MLIECLVVKLFTALCTTRPTKEANFQTFSHTLKNYVWIRQQKLQQYFNPDFWLSFKSCKLRSIMSRPKYIGVLPSMESPIKCRSRPTTSHKFVCLAYTVWPQILQHYCRNTIEIIAAVAEIKCFKFGPITMWNAHMKFAYRRYTRFW